MFAWHESTQRSVCRTGFVSLCLLPLLLVSAWAVARRLPSEPRRYADQLAARLGLEVRIAAVAHPRPGVLLFDDFALLEPERRAPVLTCRWLEVSDPGDGTLVAQAGQPEFHAAQSAWLWQLIAERLWQKTSLATGSLRLVASQATWHTDLSSQTFRNLAVRAAATEHGQEVDVSFVLADALAASPAELRLVRAPSMPDRAIGLTLDTGGARLPCSLFRPLVDPSDLLGAASTFQGRFWCSLTDQGWDGDLAGQLHQVDLDRLVSQRFPHKLSGLADLELRDVRLRAGRLVLAQGSLVAGPGAASRTLIEAGWRELALAPPAPLPELARLVRYDRLAFDFLADAGGLRLVGRCGSDEDGRLLTFGPGETYWTTTGPRQPFSTVALARMLVPQSEVFVPATPQSDRLLRWLPLPEVQPGAASDSGNTSLPETHLRFSSGPEVPAAQ